jgi:tetratricopeptide (TPR) repeat protein
MAFAKKRPTLGYHAALLAALMFLSSCLNAELEKQAEQLKQQEEELVRQRKEIEALKTSQIAQEQKLRDCSRAFREYFDKAQTTADREQAVALYRQGLALCPDDEIAHYELGRALADRGRYGEAEREFEAALKLNPEFIEAQRQLDTMRRGK